MKRAFFLLLLLGCSSLPKPKKEVSYYPLSLLLKKGWQIVSNSPSEPVFLAKGHRVKLKMGTNYAFVDGKAVNLKRPIYSLDGEVYVPSLLLCYLSPLPPVSPREAHLKPEEKEEENFASPPSLVSFSLPPFPPPSAQETGKAEALPKEVFLPKIPLPRRKKWKYIVIHHSSTERGCARTFDYYHRYKRHWKNGLGYHFVIGNGSLTPDGWVEVGRRWRRQIAGAHAGSKRYNKYGIGICLVGNFDKHPPTRRQMAALVKLTKKLMKAYRIPLSRVLPHRKVRPHPTDCPGRYFPWRSFLKALR